MNSPTLNILEECKNQNDHERENISFNILQHAFLMKTKQLNQFPFSWVAITAALKIMVDLYVNIRPLKYKSAFASGPKARGRLFDFRFIINIIIIIIIIITIIIIIINLFKVDDKKYLQAVNYYNSYKTN